MLALRRCQYVKELDSAGLSFSAHFENPISQSKISTTHKLNNLVTLMMTEIELEG